jgi:hypothetical protein
MNAKNKPNGHGALMAKSRGANGSAISSHGTGRAASDDASELSVANASASSAAAGADREAYADVAPAEDEGKQPTPTAASQSENKKDTTKKRKEGSATNAKKKIPPGTEALPIDGEAFVDAVHAQVDLIQLEVKLLKSEDEKIVQREVAYLRELRYGKRAAPIDDEVPQIIFDAPRPERDLP